MALTEQQKEAAKYAVENSLDSLLRSRCVWLTDRQIDALFGAFLAALPKPEPVAQWFKLKTFTGKIVWTTQAEGNEVIEIAPLYTTPPQPDDVRDAWQPIETAPKDGTEVLICRAVNADGKPMGDDFGLFVHRAAWWGEEGWIVYNSLVCENACFFEPTHWMPIPKAPAIAAAKGDA